MNIWCQLFSLCVQTRERQVFAGMLGDCGQACMGRNHRLQIEATIHHILQAQPWVVFHSALPVHELWCLFHMCCVLVFILIESLVCTCYTAGTRELKSWRSWVQGASLRLLKRSWLWGGGWRAWGSWRWQDWPVCCHMNILEGGFQLVVSLELWQHICGLSRQSSFVSLSRLVDRLVILVFW